MGWAEGAAKKAIEQQHARELNLEKSVRDGRIMDKVGPALFGQLQKWIMDEVARFNEEPTKQKLKVATSSRTNASNQLDTLLNVSISDNSRGPLKISYSPVTHTIAYECGIGQGEYKLAVAEDGNAYFETAYHQRKTIEEMGTEMLDRFMDSPI